MAWHRKDTKPLPRIDWVDYFTVLGKCIHAEKNGTVWAHEGYLHPHNWKWAIPTPQVGSGRGTGWPYFVKSPLTQHRPPTSFHYRTQPGIIGNAFNSYTDSQKIPGPCICTNNAEFIFDPCKYIVFYLIFLCLFLYSIPSVIKLVDTILFVCLLPNRECEFQSLSCYVKFLSWPFFS